MRTRTIRKLRLRLRKLAADGMRLSVLGLAALLVTRPGGITLLAIGLGLAGIFCSRLAASRVPGAGTARRPVSRMVNLGRYSPECLAGGPSHGLCSGVGCDCTCGHPGRARTRTARSAW